MSLFADTEKPDPDPDPPERADTVFISRQDVLAIKKRVIIGYEEYEVCPGDAVLDLSHFRESVREQSSSMGYYNQLVARAQGEVNGLVCEGERKAAEIEVSLRASAARSGRKVTEAEAKAKIRNDGGYQEIQRALVDAKKTLDLVRGIKESLEQRCEMIRILSSPTGSKNGERNET